jgi:hypothetical protein
MIARMNFYLLASALAGLGSAIGHSYLTERFLLRPMYAARGDNPVLAIASMRRVIRWVMHLPSFAWAQVALTTLWLALSGPSDALTAFAYFGAGIYLTSALANLWALRRPHVGNILLTVAALGLIAGALAN